MLDRTPLYAIERTHLDELSDRTGIMQHAAGSRPDPGHGYCTDDVARALTVDLLHADGLGWAAVAQSAGRSMAFLEAAFEPDCGRFRNFQSADGRWLEAVGSEDAHARALLALAEASTSAGDARLRAAATSLFERALPASLSLGYLRPVAAAVVAAELAARHGNRAAAASLPELARMLWQATSPAPGGGPDWPWPEAILTYENGIVPRALLRAGDRLADRSMVDRGLRLLDWLVAVQTGPVGDFSPIGNRGWWPRVGPRAVYDQQPIEATALLLAAEAAWEVTGGSSHRATMEWAYGWFLGRNDARRRVAVPATGGCHDGLTPTGVNANQGAESTLMWLTALERIRAVRRSGTGRRGARFVPGAAAATPA
jgi:hypothetical protein